MRSYRVRLSPDGSLRCNCPGWKFSEEKKKTCKHVRARLGKKPAKQPKRPGGRSGSSSNFCLDQRLTRTVYHQA